MNKTEFDKEIDEANIFLDKYLHDLAIGFEAKFERFDHIHFFGFCSCLLTKSALKMCEKREGREDMRRVLERLTKYVKE